MYFLESINTQIDSMLDILKFNNQFKKKVKDKTSIVLLLEIQELFISPKFRKLKVNCNINSTLNQNF
jgi:hypothetical protein